MEVLRERRIRAQYTVDDKAQVVSLAETLGPTKAARKLEIPVKTLANGIRRARERSGFVNDGKRLPVSEREARECAAASREPETAQEAGLYQKAAAFFAKESQ